MTDNVSPIDKPQAPYRIPVTTTEDILTEPWLLYFNIIYSILKNLQSQIDDLQDQINTYHP